jgi:hypothetical protein
MPRHRRIMCHECELRCPRPSPDPGSRERNLADRGVSAAGIDESTLVGEEPRGPLRPHPHRADHRHRDGAVGSGSDIARCRGGRFADQLPDYGAPVRSALRVHGLPRAKRCATSCHYRSPMEGVSDSGAEWAATSQSASSRLRCCFSSGRSWTRLRRTGFRSECSAGRPRPGSRSYLSACSSPSPSDDESVPALFPDSLQCCGV